MIFTFVNFRWSPGNPCSWTTSRTSCRVFPMKNWHTTLRFGITERAFSHGCRCVNGAWPALVLRPRVVHNIIQFFSVYCLQGRQPHARTRGCRLHTKHRHAHYRTNRKAGTYSSDEPTYDPTEPCTSSLSHLPGPRRRSSRE